MVKRLVHILFLLSFVFFQDLNAQVIPGSNADSLKQAGVDLAVKGQYEEASQYFSKAMKLYIQQGDSVGWVKSSLDYGETLVDRGQVRDGLSFFLNLSESVPAQLPLSVEARILNNVGWANSRLQNYEKAYSYYEKGLDLALQAQDTLMIARLQNNLAVLEGRFGNYEAALELKKENARIYRKMGNKYRLSITLNSIFSSLNKLGLFDKAAPYLRESLALRKELNNPDLIEYAYHNMGWLFAQQGKTDSAIIYYQRSLEISRMLGNPYDITQTLINIGSLHEKSGEPETALQYYEEALSYNEKTGRPVSISNNLRWIASLYSKRGKLEEAQSYYSRAESLIEDMDSPLLLGSLYLNQAYLHARNGATDKALTLSDQALEIAQEKTLLNLEIDAHTALGYIYTQTGQNRKSLSHYLKVRDLTENFPLARKIQPLINLSRTYRANASDSAFILAAQSFSLIDSLQQNITGLTFKAGLFRDYASFYKEVASWYLMEGNTTEAFKLMESAKARVLLDELAEAREQIISRLDEDTLIKRQQKIRAIDNLYEQVETATDPVKKKELQRELADAEFEYQTFINEVRLSNADWKRFNYPEPLSLAEARALLDGESGIMEFAFSGSSLIQFYLSEDEVQASLIDSLNGLPAIDYIAELEAKFREGISRKIPAEKLAEITYPLYDLLVAGFTDQHPDISNLLIVPEGPLSFLPFEAFDTGDGYLIEKYNVKYLPSVSLYNFIQSPHRPAEQDLLAVAGSGFQGAPGNSQVRSPNSYASLPATIIEVDSIASNFEEAEVLKNEAVTETGLKSLNLDRFRYIHFATHGDINQVNPSQSGLILSTIGESESAYGEDGYLNTMEISTLNLNADMVVLSACNTGVGKQINGEGLLGLQRSFLTAGASAVSVSLWNVFDRSTSVFMADFYKSMLRYKNEEYGLWNRSLDYLGWYDHPLFDYKAKAFRDAKLAMIDHPYYNHPAHWAPFILIGK